MKCQVIFPATAMMILWAIAANGMNHAQPAGEFWISTNATQVFITNGIMADNGGGTPDRPLDGSTADNFDWNMDNLPANCTVHILAGIYQTKGQGIQGPKKDNYRGWHIKSGQKIQVSGMDNTILQLSRPDLLAGTEGATVPINGLRVMGTHEGVHDCEVSDLTLDANCQGLKRAEGGLELAGTNHHIRRVRVINCAAYGAEMQGFFLTPYPPIDVLSNCMVEDCEVSSFAGGSANGAMFEAIAFWGRSFNNVIKNNRVTDGTRYRDFAAISPGNGGTLVKGNYIENVHQVFYTENTVNDFTVTGNHFNNCPTVINLYPDQTGTTMKNFIFTRNDVSVTNVVGASSWLVFQFLTNDQRQNHYENFTITGNLFISHARPADRPEHQVFLAADNLKGLVLASNVIDGKFINVFKGQCSAINIFANRDRAGKYSALNNRR